MTKSVCNDWGLICKIIYIYSLINKIKYKVLNSKYNYNV